MSIAVYFSSNNRKKKWERFTSEFQLTSDTTILDVGFSDNEFSPVDNYLEKHYPFQNKITALGVVVPDKFLRRYPDVKVVTYKGGAFPFEDNSFDIVWSNAVVEHVGDAVAQEMFIKEIMRVGRSAYFTTPNRHFPVETHTRTPFLHWLPKNIFDKYLVAVGKKYFTGSYMHLLSEGDLKRLLEKSGVVNYKLIKNRLFGFVLDFVVLIKP